ncbi:MAG: type II toxin-antitoxin system death-on-curing family toxin [Phycisphaerae bacterium]|nr:type II toxin-antitoxin system death-on-curing family toxin [Phycisphaerae bacterium]MBI9019284.1 type II toxin-antitoxin system death-on-curing family toxin [Phycisphaerae bacterium]
MPHIHFLEIEDILQIHQRLTQAHGGGITIRDTNLLLSAIAIPQTSFDGKYVHSDIFQMAAAYMFHLVQNHPFVDGNKRVGAAAAIIFLKLNDIEFKIDNNTLVQFTLAVAKGEKDKQAIAEFFKRHCSGI